MAPPARTLKVTYGGVEFGGLSARQLDGPLRLRTHNYETLILEFDFIIAKTTVALFAAEVVAVEAALRTPNVRLLIEDGATVIQDFDPDPAENTGFNSRGEIIKQGELSSDSVVTRKYTASIEVQLPATEAGKSGRRNVTISIIPNEADHLDITVEGQYTALATNSASAQYDAAHDTFIATVITTYGASGTFERIEKERTPDDEDKVLDFKTVMREIVFDQSSSGTDNTVIVDPVMKVRRTKDHTTPNAPGSPISRSGGRPTGRGRTSSAPPLGSGLAVKKLLQGEIFYEANIEKSFSSATGASRQTDMINLFEGTIRPWIITSIKKVMAIQSVAIILSAPETDLYTGKITVTGSFVGVPLGARVVDYSLEEELQSETGETLVPVWSGKPFDKEKFPNAARLLMKRMETYKAVERGGIARLARVFGDPLRGEGNLPTITGLRGGEWVLATKRLVGKPKLFGIPNISGTTQFSLVEYVYESFYEFRTIPSGTSTSARGRGATVARQRQ